jgi:hypothetical protein
MVERFEALVDELSQNSSFTFNSMDCVMCSMGAYHRCRVGLNHLAFHAYEKKLI